MEHEEAEKVFAVHLFVFVRVDFVIVVCAVVFFIVAFSLSSYKKFLFLTFQNTGDGIN